DGIARVEATTQGDPLDTDTMIGAQASNDQLEKILSYLDIGRQEGAKLLTGGERAELGGHLSGGYYVTPPAVAGDGSMRLFQEGIGGPGLGARRGRGAHEAIRLANDTRYGPGWGGWSRQENTSCRPGRAIQAGRGWVNTYRSYPAHAAFGG